MAQIDLIENFLKNHKDTSQHVTIWSCDTEILTHINEVAIKGKGITLTADMWVQEGYEEGKVKLPDNPTWLDLWLGCDQIVKMTGDDHHVFIESFTYDTKKNKIEVFFGS